MKNYNPSGTHRTAPRSTNNCSNHFGRIVQSPAYCEISGERRVSKTIVLHFVAIRKPRINRTVTMQRQQTPILDRKPPRPVVFTFISCRILSETLDRVGGQLWAAVLVSSLRCSRGDGNVCSYMCIYLYSCTIII